MREDREDRTMSGAGTLQRTPRVTPRGCLEDERVLAFIEGQLTATQRSRVEEHLARCAACRRLVARLGRTLAGNDGSDPAGC
jgi:hypothetical protein